MAFAATNGGWFRLTENDGCGSCTVIWRRDGDEGGWRRLAEISGREAYGGRVITDFGPLSAVVATQDGRHGWAWYKTLWSTHDGGATWGRVTDGPGRASETGRQVVLTEDHAWSLRNGQLWRSPLDRDAWVRIQGHDLSGAVGLLALTDRVVVQAYDEGLSNPRLMGSAEGSEWVELALPCPGETRPRANGNTVFVACGNDAESAVVHNSTNLAAWQVLGRVRAPEIADLVPMGPRRVLVLGRPNENVILDARGTEPVDFPRQPGLVYGASSRAQVTYLLTQSGAMRSTDGGRTWHRARE